MIDEMTECTGEQVREQADDHVQARCNGGGYHVFNILPSCTSCTTEKDRKDLLLFLVKDRGFHQVQVIEWLDRWLYMCEAASNMMQAFARVEYDPSTQLAKEKILLGLGYFFRSKYPDRSLVN